jgi:hypothetical protein
MPQYLSSDIVFKDNTASSTVTLKSSNGETIEFLNNIRVPNCSSIVFFETSVADNAAIKLKITSGSSSSQATFGTLCPSYASDDITINATGLYLFSVSLTCEGAAPQNTTTSFEVNDVIKLAYVYSTVLSSYSFVYPLSINDVCHITIQNGVNQATTIVGNINATRIG